MLFRSYNGNGSDGGTVPVDSGTYNTGEAVTVAANSGTLTLTGSTFSGWNTAANGSGITYPVGSSFVMGKANVTLYALWV